MTSMRDGLGGEELAPSGVWTSGTVLVHPYFPGSVTSMDQFSGTDFYATDDIHGENIYGDTLVSGATVLGDVVSGTSIWTTTISGTDYINDLGEMQSVAAGSTYGAIVQAGSATLGSNEVWVEFKTAYAGTPIVTVSNMDNVGSQTVWVGSTIGTGSFSALGVATDDEFSWIAVGI